MFFISDDEDDEFHTAPPQRNSQPIDEGEDTISEDADEGEEDADEGEEDASSQGEDASTECADEGEDASSQGEDASSQGEDASTECADEGEDASSQGEDASTECADEGEDVPVPELDNQSLSLIMSNLEERPGFFSVSTLLKLMNTSKSFRHACSALIIKRIESKSIEGVCTVSRLLPDLFKGIATLSLYRARLSHIEPLAQIGGGLKVLNISNTAVESIDALESLHNLEELYCSNTRITSIQCLHQKVSLKLLEMRDCCLLRHAPWPMSNFPVLPTLETLDLSGVDRGSLLLWESNDNTMPNLKMYAGNLYPEITSPPYSVMQDLMVKGHVNM